MTKILARAACLALGLATVPAAAADRAFVMNQFGGVVTCDLAHNPLATAKMAAYCSGATVRSADPSKFDCSSAETDSEYAYCRKPVPTRAR